MSTTSIGEFVMKLRPAMASLSDAALVAEFCARRESPVFAELLRRFGPMVLGLCNRILSNPHDAEDAFQAVFLVLACKANKIRPQGAVGSWLYGVALRTARKSKTAAARRYRREMIKALSRPEQPVATEPDPFETAEIRRIIDDEIGRLPARLRAPIVHCDLRGKSRSQAAQQLGWPESTVAARLAKAHKVLAGRLTRRGVTLPATGLTTFLVPGGVSAALAQTTAATAESFAKGSVATTVCPAVRLLAEGVIWSMKTTQLTWWLTAGLLAAAVLVGGTALVLRPGDAASAVEPALARGMADPPAAKESGPTWKKRTVLEHNAWLVGSLTYSPDGSMLVVGGTDGHVLAYDAKEMTTKWDHKEGSHFAAVAFSLDGKTIAATCKDGIELLNPETGKVTEKLTETGVSPIAVAFFPKLPIEGTTSSMHKVIFGDIHHYAVKLGVSWDKASTIRTEVRPDGKPISDPYAVPLAVSPQGNRVVLTGPIDRETGKNVLWAWSAGSGAVNKLLVGHRATVTAAAWSSDGSTIATGDADGMVIFWDGATFEKKSQMELGARVAAITLSADGKRIAVAATRPDERKDADQFTEELYVWNVQQQTKKPQPLSRHAVGGNFGGIASVAFSPDANTLAVGFCCFDHLNRLGVLIGEATVWEYRKE